MNNDIIVDDEITIDDALFFYQYGLNSIYNTYGINELYHYSSLNNIVNILKGKSIYFSEVTNFNDTTEGKLIIRYYEAACKSLLDNKKISVDFYDILKDTKMVNKILFIDKTKNQYYVSEYETYILCFSKKFNSKECYKDFSNYPYGGNINFSSFILNQINDEFNKKNIDCSNLLIDSVIYSPKECEKNLYNELLKLYLLIKPYEEELKDYKDKIQYSVITLLKLKQYFFIKSTFKKQEEIRIVYFRPKGLNNEFTKIVKRNKLKNNQSKTLQFVKFKIHGNYDYIKTIYLSNNNNLLKDKKNIDFLKKTGIEIKYTDFNQ